MIKKCVVCGNKRHSQDELHGVGNRVFNVFKHKLKGLVGRCTVCGREEVVSDKQ